MEQALALTLPMPGQLKHEVLSVFWFEKIHVCGSVPNMVMPAKTTALVTCQRS